MVLTGMIRCSVEKKYKRLGVMMDSGGVKGEAKEMLSKVKIT